MSTPPPRPAAASPCGLPPLPNTGTIRNKTKKKSQVHKITNKKTLLSIWWTLIIVYQYIRKTKSQKCKLTIERQKRKTQLWHRFVYIRTVEQDWSAEQDWKAHTVIVTRLLNFLWGRGGGCAETDSGERSKTTKHLEYIGSKHQSRPKTKNRYRKKQPASAKNDFQ